jgi:hypothetical protein
MLMTGMAQAQVTNLVYQDTFARSGPLSGSMPDTANASGAKYIAGPLVYTGTWTDQNGNTENACYFSNSIPAVLGPIFNEAFLPITVQTGHVYTVSASFLVNTNYNGNYMFLAYDTCRSLQIIPNSWYAGMLLRSTNNPYASGNLQTFAGANQASAATNYFTPSGTPWNPQFITLTSVLNLTNPAAITEYWFTNGVPIRTNLVGGNIAGGNNGMWPRYITFGQSSAAGYVTNLTFTDVVPYPSGPTILEQPNNLSAPQGQTATFWVNAAGTPDPAYQWMTNNGSGWVNIPGATNATYTTPPLSSAYNSLNYRVELTNVAGLLDSDPATLTVTAANPTVFSATRTTPTSIVVNFSGAVDLTTSQTAANYSLNNGASVIAVSAGSVSSSVVLTTSALTPGGAYNLAVKNVQDLFSDVMATSTNVVLPAGLVLDLRGDSGVQLDASGSSVAQWLDQTTNGNNASQFFGWRQSTSGISRPSTTTRPTASTLNGLPALTFNASALSFLQVASTPSVSIDTNLTIYCVAQVSDTAVNRHFISKNVGNIPGSFELDGARAAANGPVEPDLINGSAGSGNSSVLGGSGVVSAPHVFAGTRAFQAIYTNAWTAGLSFPPAQTNWFYTASNYASVYLDGIATASAALNSAAPGLRDGGEPIFIGTRQDHFGSDIMNGQIAEILLFNIALAAADRTNVDNYLGLKYFPFTITSDLPPSTTSSNGYRVTYTFGANQGSAHLTFQWQKNGTNIPGAINSTYTTPPLLQSDNGETFDVLVTTSTGSTAYSTTNTLTVLDVAPYITATGIPIWNKNQVIVIFDKAVDPATATNKANYSLDQGASILSAAMGDSPNKVVLTTSALTWSGNPGFYTLTVSNVKDTSGIPMASASLGLGLYPPATALWVRADTGVTADPDANVTQWSDMSGLGNDLFGDTNVFPVPLLATNAQGDPVVRFAATNRTTLFANPSSSLGIVGDMSIIAVVNFATLDGGTNGEIVSKTGIGSHANVPAPFDFYVTAPNNGGKLYRGDGNTASQSTATIGPSLGTPHVLVASETGNNVSHFLDGVACGTSPIVGGLANESDSLDAGGYLFLGTRGDGLLRLTGDISELIIAGSPISSGDVASLQTYLFKQHHLVNTTPSNLTVSAANNQLTFSWPTDHLGWGFQSNSVGLTATGSWFAVPGASATNQITLPINPAETNVFYRMIYPPQ